MVPSFPLLNFFGFLSFLWLQTLFSVVVPSDSFLTCGSFGFSRTLFRSWKSSGKMHAELPVIRISAGISVCLLISRRSPEWESERGGIQARESKHGQLQNNGANLKFTRALWLHLARGFAERIQLQNPRRAQHRGMPRHSLGWWGDYIMAISYSEGAEVPAKEEWVDSIGTGSTNYQCIYSASTQ